jgi:hypothetical protein
MVVTLLGVLAAGAAVVADSGAALLASDRLDGTAQLRCRS